MTSEVELSFHMLICHLFSLVNYISALHWWTVFFFFNFSTPKFYFIVMLNVRWGMYGWRLYFISSFLLLKLADEAVTITLEFAAPEEKENMLKFYWLFKLFLKNGIWYSSMIKQSLNSNFLFIDVGWCSFTMGPKEEKEPKTCEQS